MPQFILKIKKTSQLIKYIRATNVCGTRSFIFEHNRQRAYNSRISREEYATHHHTLSVTKTTDFLQVVTKIKPESSA